MKRYKVYLKDNIGPMPNFSVIGDSLTTARSLGSSGEAVSYVVDLNGECVAIIPLDAAVQVEEIKP